jgi:hypothetical protein
VTKVILVILSKGAVFNRKQLCRKYMITKPVAQAARLQTVLNEETVPQGTQHSAAVIFI